MRDSRRLLGLAAALVFIETMFFTALAPLLPHYVDALSLSEAQVGLLSGSYAFGAVVMAVPAGVLVRRWGPKTIVISGLAAIAVSSVVFAVGSSVGVLDAARFGQGAAGALIFSGALTWAIDGYSAEERGAVIGTVGGASIFGALLGPAVGGLAAEVGILVAFGAVVVVTLMMLALAARVPDDHVVEDRAWRDVASVLARPAIVRSGAFLLAPAICAGLWAVVVPLRIDVLGGSAAVIAGVYIVVAAGEAGLAPPIGKLSDRVGRRKPYVAGVGLCAVATLGIAAAGTLPVVVAVVMLSSLGAALCVTPGFADLSDAAEAISLHQGLAMGLGNLAWSLGNLVGAVGGGALAASGGMELPLILVAGLLTVTFIGAGAPLVGIWPAAAAPCRGGTRR